MGPRFRGGDKWDAGVTKGADGDEQGDDDERGAERGAAGPTGPLDTRRNEMCACGSLAKGGSRSGAAVGGRSL